MRGFCKEVESINGVVVFTELSELWVRVWSLFTRRDAIADFAHKLDDLTQQQVDICHTVPQRQNISENIQPEETLCVQGDPYIKNLR